MEAPVSDESENPIRSAFDTCDDPYRQEVPLLKVGADGIPATKILVDLESKDLQALWVSREPYLWFVILVCSIYFLLILGAF